MKTNKALIALLVVVGVSFVSAKSQPFQSGSNGSYGPLNVTTSDVTLDVPADGIFHCTTISITGGRTLRFRRNALNTPIHLLATGDVTINGVIDISGARGSASAPGLAGPGGFDGGAPGSVGLPGGDGQGPGAGKAGTSVGSNPNDAGPGSYATASQLGPEAKRGATYGSPLLFPIVGGSGGGGASGNPGWGGGGGGGAIVIASSSRITVAGGAGVRSWGGQVFSGSVVNSGSGGAIRLVAPVVSGVGSLDVRGNTGQNNQGDGRIRVDALDRSGVNFDYVPDNTASVGGFMAVFPNPLPRIDITEAAGLAVPLDTPTQVLLPTGSPANQTIKIQARDFGQPVPIRVVLTPDNGTSQGYDAQIENGASNPAETTVNVTFPVNVLTHVHVWTR